MATLSNITLSVRANIENFQRKMEIAEKRVKRFGKKMSRIGSTMSRNVTLPLAIMGGGAIKAAADFESSFANVRKTVDATEEEFKNLEDSIRKMSKEIPKSVNELNKIAGVAGQLGVETKNIADFTETIAMMGDTTDLEGERAALALSRFMNIMGTAQGDIDRVGSTVVGLGNEFAAMESEIVEIGTSLASFGNQINLSEDEVLAYATTIASSGGKAQAASTAFQKMAQDMKKSVLTGDEKLKKFAETADMTVTEFKRLFQKDAAQAILEFLKGLRKIEEEGGSAALALDKVNLADQRMTREIGKVTGNLDQLEESLKVSSEEWRDNTALTKEAEERYKTFRSQLKLVWNRIVNVGITIGRLLMPYVKKLIGRVENLVKWFENLSPKAKKVSVKIGLITAAIGPALLVIGKLGPAMWAAARSMVLAAKFASRNMKTALITTGYGAIVVAAGIAVAQIIKHWDTLNEAVRSIPGFEAAKKGFKDLTESGKRLFGELRDIVVELSKNMVKTGFLVIVAGIKTLKTAWEENFQGIRTLTQLLVIGLIGWLQGLNLQILILIEGIKKLKRLLPGRGKHFRGGSGASGEYELPGDDGDGDKKTEFEKELEKQQKEYEKIFAKQQKEFEKRIARLRRSGKGEPSGPPKAPVKKFELPTVEDKAPLPLSSDKLRKIDEYLDTISPNVKNFNALLDEQDKKLKENSRTMQEMNSALENSIDSLTGEFGNMFGAMIKGQDEAGKAFENFGEKLKDIFVDLVAQMLKLIVKLVIIKGITTLITGGTSQIGTTLGSLIAGGIGGGINAATSQSSDVEFVLEGDQLSGLMQNNNKSKKRRM